MSTSYTEKTHSAFHGAPIDTSDPKTLAWLIRRHGLEMTHISRGSHIGAIFSVAEIMAVLYTRILRVDPKNPQWENRDRLILSKGHAGASVYAALAERALFPGGGAFHPLRQRLAPVRACEPQGRAGCGVFHRFFGSRAERGGRHGAGRQEGQRRLARVLHLRRRRVRRRLGL